jgi:hypothetical protein
VSHPTYEWMNLADASDTRRLAVHEQHSDSDALPYAVILLAVALLALAVIALVLR